MTESATPPTSAIVDGLGRTSRLQQLWRRREALVLPLLFVVAVIGFSILAPSFLTVENLTNVARQSVFLLIVSLGQLMVLIGGGLDLSVGTIAALTSVVSATVMATVFQALPDSPIVAILAGVTVGILIGAVAGVINGLGSTVLRIHSFMMTLGMSSVLFGITLFLSSGASIDGLPPQFGQAFGFGEIFGVPVPTLVALALVIVVYVLLEWTRFGRHLYATGGNLRAAELSGVRTMRVNIMAFVLAGVLASITGLLLTARLGTGESNIGASLPLESIAACVIAGVSLAGGTGRTLSVLLGTLLIMLVENGLSLMQVGAYASTMAIGVILIFAMAVSRR